MADIAELLWRLVTLINQTNNRILSNLREDADQLQELHSDFVSLLA
jgi:hypothetical protein